MLTLSGQIATGIIVSFVMFFLSSSITVLAQQPQQGPWIGIAGIDITADIARASGLKEANGFLVTEVTSGSPAHKAGIRGGSIITNINGAQIPLGGDIILRIDNRTISTINDVHSYLDTKNVGEAVQLTIAREGVIKNIRLTLDAAPSFMSEASVLQLQLLGMNTFYDNNEFNPGLHIVGEVLNNSTKTASYVQVSTTLYDTSGQVVGVGSTSTVPSTVESGKKAPFEIVVYAENVKGGNLSIVHNVSVQVSSI